MPRIAAALIARSVAGLSFACSCAHGVGSDLGGCDGHSDIYFHRSVVHI